MKGQFLSPEWFDALESTLASITTGEAGEPGLTLGQVIQDHPTGTISYTMCLGSGTPGRLVRDSVEDAEVTLVEDFPSALSIHEGASVADLLASGRIKIRGDANALLRAATELAALSQALGTIRD